MRRLFSAAAMLLCLAGPAMPAAAAEALVLASTTSTEQSGLFAHLLPRFTQESGIAVKVLALGTGQALELARRGDADVLLVHDPAAEEKFVAEGFGLRRMPVMFNDFVLLGPASDPLGLRGSDALRAMKLLGAGTAAFISRGDKSGTHAAELRLWQAAELDLSRQKPAGYRECGCGMGPALNMAAALNAYVLADRGTWAAFKNRGELALLVQGDGRLHNPYAVIVVNPARHPHVKQKEAQALADWLVSPRGQRAIADYKIGGEALFFPLAGR
ncbi:tungstate transport system substrate-binding protein [Paucibacter oligotrophus]|uniref:Tungstate transport system substrate-binding protein n=2 Tax=Roseateles oligotrophus TaxID=1769250 RepID=A0A840L5U6_9BURK|nr:tungstate transport system substrate-binding protein [Roseateles oligotrophus]